MSKPPRLQNKYGQGYVVMNITWNLHKSAEMGTNMSYQDYAVKFGYDYLAGCQHRLR